MTDRTPRTALLVAFHPEWDALLPRIADASVHDTPVGRVVTGSLAGRAVVVAETGISMVNAAMATQALIDRHAVERIVVSGIAGGLDPALTVGDVIAPRRWEQFLEVGMGRAGPDGPTLPPLPGATALPHYGMMMPRDVMMGGAAYRAFAADDALLAVAAHLPGVRIAECGTSGSAFVDNGAYRDYLFATFGAQIIDMESAAVAQVAFANRVPFIVFRALSDLAGGEPEDNHFPLSMNAAAEACAAVVESFVSALPR